MIDVEEELSFNLNVSFASTSYSSCSSCDEKDENDISYEDLLTSFFEQIF